MMKIVRVRFATIDFLDSSEDGMFVSLRKPGEKKKRLLNFHEVFGMVEIKPNESKEATELKLQAAFGTTTKGNVPYLSRGKILLFGDTHQNTKAYRTIVTIGEKKCYFIICTGDIETFENYEVPFFFVAGNHCRNHFNNLLLIYLSTETFKYFVLARLLNPTKAESSQNMLIL